MSQRSLRRDLSGGASATGHRLPRIRPDSDLSVRERQIRDTTALEVYHQALLSKLREGRDPNDSEADDVDASAQDYEPPVFDSGLSAETTAAEFERVHHLQRFRTDALGDLRRDKAHRARSQFDQLTTELETWIASERHFTALTNRSPTGGPQGRRAGRGGAASHSAVSSRAAARVADDGDDDDTTDEIRLVGTPTYIKGKLRPYQVEGLNWMLSLRTKAVSGILADEMGLGKTFQTVALLSYLKYSAGIGGPHLVVCPLSVVGNWYREFKRWCPTMRIFKFHGSREVRPTLIKTYLTAPLKFDVIITTYDMVMREFSAIQRINWVYLALDEAHKLKNDEGLLHSTLSKISSLFRLLITGTPLQNNLKELWALLNFLSPTLFNDSTPFVKWFNAADGSCDDTVVSQMHRLLSPLMIRRLKSDVATDLPPKREIYVGCHVTKKQREWYLKCLARDSEPINRMATNGTGVSREALLNIVMQLRKACNHPYLFPGAEEGDPCITTQALIDDCGKMMVLDKILKRLLVDDADKKNKVLIFSQMTRMLDILEDYCTFRGFDVCRLDGGTKTIDRDTQMAVFNDMNSSKVIFLLSTRAGGLGINLQAANSVIIYDSDWNPQSDLQAQDRAHRIGQTRPVRVFRFVTDKTIEERIYQRALKKLYLDAAVVQQGRVLQQKKTNQQASKEELLSMVRFGADEMFRATKSGLDDEGVGVGPSDSDIDNLLAEGASKMEQLQAEAAKATQASLASFKMGVAEANIYDFDGIDYRDDRPSRVLRLELSEPMTEADLRAKCVAFGDVTKCVIHPNLREALVTYRTQISASNAKRDIGLSAQYALRDAVVVVTHEMIDKCWNAAGEALGRGARRRDDPVEAVTEEQIEQMTKTTKAPPLKLPRKPQVATFQLFNKKRIEELYAVEVSLLVRNWRKRYDPASLAEGAAASESALEEVMAPEEVTERDTLLAEGFPTWTYQEYTKLIRALKKGIALRGDFESLSRIVESKSPNEVRDYVTALFEKGKDCIPNFKRFQQQVDRVQQRAESRGQLLDACMWKAQQAASAAAAAPGTVLHADDSRCFNMRHSGISPDVARKMFLHAASRRMDGRDLWSWTRSLPEVSFDVFVQSRAPSFFDGVLKRMMGNAHHEWRQAHGLLGGGASGADGVGIRAAGKRRPAAKRDRADAAAADGSP
mgnify:CR=1 FL=1